MLLHTFDMLNTLRSNHSYAVLSFLLHNSIIKIRSPIMLNMIPIANGTESSFTEIVVNNLEPFQLPTVGSSITPVISILIETNIPDSKKVEPMIAFFNSNPPYIFYL
jgi:hypothetical protein